MLVKLFNLRRNPFSNGEHAWICAELVEFFLKDFVGLDLDTNEFEVAGPKNIHRICEKYAKRIEQNG